MTLRLGDALWGGYQRLTTRAGVTLFLATLGTQLLASVVNDSLLADLPDDAGGALAPTEPTPLAVGLSPGALAALGLVALALSALVTLVSLRTFAAGDEAVSAEHLENVLVPGLHLLGGGLVLFAATVAGLALFVVPGLFVLASFVLFQVVVAVEDEPAHRALAEAWRLASGHRLRLLGLGLAAVLAALAVVLPLSTLVVAVAGPDSVAAGVVGAAGGSLVAVFGLAVLVDAYRQLTDGEATGTDGDDEFEVDTDWAQTNG